MDDVAKAHLADLQTQAAHNVRYLLSAHTSGSEQPESIPI